MKLFKTQEGSETWDENGNVSQYDLKYYVSDAATKQAAMEEVWNDSPTEYEGIPRSGIRFDSIDSEKNCEITVLYQKKSGASQNKSDEKDEETSTVSFDCGGGSKKVLRSIGEQRVIRGERLSPGRFIGWNGKNGPQMEISGVEIPDAQLRETYTKRVKLSSLDSKWKRMVADMVGKVNKAEFKTWKKGEVMFLGCSFSGVNDDSAEIDVNFNFMIQLNESEFEIGDGVEKFSKEGFEYPWVITSTKAVDGKPQIKIDAVFVAKVTPYADFSRLGL